MTDGVGATPRLTRPPVGIRATRVIMLFLTTFTLAGCVVDVDLGRSRVGDAHPDAAPDLALADAITRDGMGFDLDLFDDGVFDRGPRDAGPPDRAPDAAPDHDLPPDAGADMSPDDGPPEPRSCERCVAALAARVEGCVQPDCELASATLDTCLVDTCQLPPPDDCALCAARTERLLFVCRTVATPAACDRLAEVVTRDCHERCQSCEDCLAGVLAEPLCAAATPTDCSDALVARFGRCAPPCAPEPMLTCADLAGARYALCGGRVAECDRALMPYVESCRRTALTDACTACPATRAAEHMGCLALGFEALVCGARDEAIGARCEATCAGDRLGLCSASGRVAAVSCDALGGASCVDLGAQLAARCLAATGMPVDACQDCASVALANAVECLPRTDEACLQQIEVDWNRCLTRCGDQASVGDCLSCGRDADRVLARCLVAGENPVRCLTNRVSAETACGPRCGSMRPEALPCAVRAAFAASPCADGDAACVERLARVEAACRFLRGE